MNYIKTVGELIDLLKQHPRNMKVEIVYEIYAHRNIAYVEQEDSNVILITYDP